MPISVCFGDRLDYLAYPTQEDVAEELGVGQKTIDRDLSQNGKSANLTNEFDFLKVDNVWRFQHVDRHRSIYGFNCSGVSS